MNEIKSLQAMVLGDRDFPLSPQVRLRGDFADKLTAVVEEGRRRLPDLTYEDVLRIVLRAGLVQVERVLAAQGRIERGGHVSFPSVELSNKAARQLDAARGAVIQQAGLAEHGLLIPATATLAPPQPQGPKDTVSTVHAPRT